MLIFCLPSDEVEHSLSPVTSWHLDIIHYSLFSSPEGEGEEETEVEEKKWEKKAKSVKDTRRVSSGAPLASSRGSQRGGRRRRSIPVAVEILELDEIAPAAAMEDRSRLARPRHGSIPILCFPSFLALGSTDTSHVLFARDATLDVLFHLSDYHFSTQPRPYTLPNRRSEGP